MERMKKIKVGKILLMLFLIMTIFCAFSNNVRAEDKIDIYFFEGDGCSHCKDELAFLEQLKKDYTNLDIHMYEVWHNEENKELMKKMTTELGLDIKGVPFTIIGDKYFAGYSEEYVRPGIIDAITSKGANEFNIESYSVNIPVIGKVYLKDISLPVITVLMGIVDGFNPCAMWILLFLISILIGQQNRKKMWVLGITFILASSIMYFLFMVAWLNLTLFIGSMFWVRLLIALVAIIGGAFSLFTVITKKEAGCTVIDDNKRIKIFSKIKEITGNKKFVIAIIGMILLGVSVNLIELLCSAGLPVVYTQILALNEVSKMQYYLYILLYILFFMLDDIIIFVIAMVTLKMTGISTKYGKISHIVGGILMLLIGILLIFNPGILMFG